MSLRPPQWHAQASERDSGKLEEFFISPAEDGAAVEALDIFFMLIFGDELRARVRAGTGLDHERRLAGQIITFRRRAARGVDKRRESHYVSLCLMPRGGVLPIG